MATNLGMMDIE